MKRNSGFMVMHSIFPQSVERIVLNKRKGLVCKGENTPGMILDIM